MTAAACVVDLAAHTASVPFARTLGARWLGGDATGIRLQLPLAPAVSDGHGAVDLRAVVALLDHAGGAAVYAAVPASATATLELRVDVTGAPPAGSDLVVSAATAVQQHGSALVLGQADCGDAARPFVRLTARYIVGSGPGQAPADAAYVAAREQAVARYAALPAAAMASFDATLGGSHSAHGWELPFADRLVGSVTLPALHGGVVAAGLMTIAMHVVQSVSPLRLAAVTVRYLRAAQAQPTSFTARVAKAGSRAVFLDGQALQGDRPVATLHALFG